MKKSKFQLCRCAVPPKKIRPVIPKVGQLSDTKNHSSSPQNIKPTENVVRKLGDPSLTIGIDIEVHDWKELAGAKGCSGPFGFYTRQNADLAFGRIVQIGWAIHNEGEGFKEINEMYVKPEGFQVAKRASDYHGISQDMAVREGHPLEFVMVEFMTVVGKVVEAGGRVIVHHLEYDAGIIMHELGRAGLYHMVPKWEKFAKDGCCTLDPEIGEWVRDCFRMEVSKKTKCNMLSLGTLATILVPDDERVLNKLHTAACDAHLHVLVFKGLVKLAQRNGAPP